MSSAVEMASEEKKEPRKKVKFSLVPNPTHFPSLFAHQRASIYEMETLEREREREIEGMKVNTKIGILANEMGSGKTLTMLGVIARDRMKGLESGGEEDRITVREICCVDRTGSYTINRERSHSVYNTTLVLASLSVLGQWESELRKTKLSYYSITRKATIWNEEFDPNDYHLVLVTPSMFKSFHKRYEEIVWKRFVIDEPDSISIPKFPRVQAVFTWLITATPARLFDVKGQKHYVKDLFQYRYGPLENGEVIRALAIRLPPAYIRKSISVPPSFEVTHHVLGNRLLQAMQDHLDPEIATLIQAGNVREALHRLGGKPSSNLVDLIRRSVKEDIAEARQKIALYQQRDLSISTNQKLVDAWVGKLKTYQEKLASVEESYQAALKRGCCVCWTPTDQPVLRTCCQNIFCEKCMAEWKARGGDCPMCRQEGEIFYLKKDHEEKVEEKVEEEKEEPRNKDEVIKEIIREGKRVLICSHHEQSWFGLSHDLREAGIRFGELKGHKSTRERLVREFRARQTPVLFISSRENGAGINLPWADELIIYHQMDDLTEKQLIARSQRIGRESSLRIHRFIEDL